MNISHPIPQSSGIRPLQEPQFDQMGKTEQGRDKKEGPSAVKGSLWEILTPEEREFFEQQASLGPVTYRPGRTSPQSVPAPTGRRIDVRG